MNPILLSTVFTLLGVCSVIGSREKLLQILKETVPGIATVGVFAKVEDLGDILVWKKTASETEAEIRYNNFEKTLVLLPEPVRYDGNLEEAFSIMLKQSSAFIMNWLADQKLTPVGLGLGWKIFDEQTPKTIRFVISASYENASALEAKGLAAFRKRALELHNTLRAKHGAVPLALINNMAELKKNVIRSAQGHADTHQWEDGLTQSEESSTGKCGENLYHIIGSCAIPFAETAAERTCNFWYDKKNGYDFDTPQFSYKTGLFTQLVWKATTELNVGICYGMPNRKTDTRRYAVVVGRYYEAGNVIGGNNDMQNFRDNVEKAR